MEHILQVALSISVLLNFLGMIWILHAILDQDKHIQAISKLLLVIAEERYPSKFTKLILHDFTKT